MQEYSAYIAGLAFGVAIAMVRYHSDPLVSIYMSFGWQSLKCINARVPHIFKKFKFLQITNFHKVYTNFHLTKTNISNL